MIQATNYLSALIDACRGSYRNMEDYARDCNLGVATIYRIARGQFKKMPAEEVLRAMVDNADPSRGITYEELTNAIDNVLKSQEANPMDRSRKIRRDAQRAVETFREVVAPYIQASGVEVIREYTYPQTKWDYKILVLYEGKEEEWIFDVKYHPVDSPRKLLLKDKVAGTVGRFIFDEGADLEKKWLHVVIASPSEDIKAFVENRFTHVNLAVPVSVIPLCTENNVIYPEMVLYHGHTKRPVS